MKPTEFPQQTIVWAKDQPEYIPLPAHVTQDEQRRSISFFALEEGDIEKILAGGGIWTDQMTFGNRLQPIAFHLECPFKETDEQKVARLNMIPAIIEYKGMDPKEERIYGLEQSLKEIRTILSQDITSDNIFLIAENINDKINALLNEGPYAGS